MKVSVRPLYSGDWDASSRIHRKVTTRPHCVMLYHILLDIMVEGEEKRIIVWIISISALYKFTSLRIFTESLWVSIVCSLFMQYTKPVQLLVVITKVIPIRQQLTILTNKTPFMMNDVSKNWS